jgi:ribosome-binding factor A
MVHLQRKHQADPLSQRQRRVGELIRQLIAEYIQRGNLYYDGVELPVTVSEVRMSVDMRHAYIYLMPLGGTDQQKCLMAFKDCAKKLRSELARKLPMRAAPQLHMEIDEIFDRVQNLQNVLNTPKVSMDLNERLVDNQ